MAVVVAGLAAWSEREGLEYLEKKMGVRMGGVKRRTEGVEMEEVAALVEREEAIDRDWRRRTAIDREKIEGFIRCAARVSADHEWHELKKEFSPFNLSSRHPFRANCLAVPARHPYLYRLSVQSSSIPKPRF